MSVMSERHSMLEERTNEHGHLQTYLCEEGEPEIAVCSQCTAFVRPNTGQGTACDSCAHDSYMEAQLDYETHGH